MNPEVEKSRAAIFLAQTPVCVAMPRALGVAGAGDAPEPCTHAMLGPFLNTTAEQRLALAAGVIGGQRCRVCDRPRTPLLGGYVLVVPAEPSANRSPS